MTFLLNAVFFFLAAPARAAGPGTSAATFLTLGYGARPVGVGEAFTAMADDVSALYYNPAGLAWAPSPVIAAEPAPYEFLVAHSMHIQDVALDQIGFVRRPFGVSLTSLRVGGIEARDSDTAAPTGNLGASDLALGLSAAHKFGPVGFGGTAKFINQTLASVSAQAYALDLGVLARLPDSPWSLGASLSNLGTEIKFIDQPAPLPRTWRVGATYGMTPEFPHALSAQLDLPRDSAPMLRLGLEYLGFGPLALRFGYRTYSTGQRDAALGKALGTSASGLNEFYGLYLGMGLRTKLGSLDYAMIPYGELGSAHRLSLSLRFGQPKKDVLAQGAKCADASTTCRFGGQDERGGVSSRGVQERMLKENLFLGNAAGKEF